MDPHLMTLDGVASPAGRARPAASLPHAAGNLKRRLRRAELRQRLKAYGLILPLFVFMLLTFLVPLALMLFNSVSDPVVADALPRSAPLLRAMPAEQGVPDEPVFAALAADMKESVEAQTASKVASRLNY